MPTEARDQQARQPQDTAGTRPRREPWPWIIAGMLTFMIAASLSFFAIAASHPDATVSAERKPGLESP